MNIIHENFQLSHQLIDGLAIWGGDQQPSDDVTANAIGSKWIYILLSDFTFRVFIFLKN